MRLEEIIHELEHKPKKVLVLPEVRTPRVFDAWVRRCLELTSDNPHDGLPHVDTALVISTTNCQAVQCFGIMAAVSRNLGDLSTGFLHLEHAFRLSRGCKACEADLLRRRGLMHTSANQKHEAFADTSAAVQAYLTLDGPDHDLAGHGLADALLARGDVRQYFGAVDLAIGDFGKVLTLVNPCDHPFLYSYAQRALGTVLRAKGGLDNLLTANQHMTEAWKYFKARKSQASRERAYLDWQTAMVRLELRRYPEGGDIVTESPATLRKRMKRAQTDFVDVSMPAESTAVASDLALLAYPERPAIIEVMDDALKLVQKRWASFTPEVKTGFLPVRDAIRDVCQFANHDVMALTWEEFRSRMRLTIERLRETCAEAAQGELLPCLLTWPDER